MRYREYGCKEMREVNLSKSLPGHAFFVVSTSPCQSGECLQEKCLLVTMTLFRMAPRIVDSNLSTRFLVKSYNRVQSDTCVLSSLSPSWPCSFNFTPQTLPFLLPSIRQDHFHAVRFGEKTRAVSWRGPLRRKTRRARHCTSTSTVTPTTWNELHLLVGWMSPQISGY